MEKVYIVLTTWRHDNGSETLLRVHPLAYTDQAKAYTICLEVDKKLEAAGSDGSISATIMELECI